MKAILKRNLVPNSNSKYVFIYLEAVTAIFIILWIYTGISKLIDWRSVSLQMMTNPIFKGMPKLATFGGPVLELCLAILLVFKRTRLLGFYLSFVLMSFFTFYVSYLMIYLPTLPCSCGGVISSLNWTQHLVMNILLTIISVSAIILYRKRKAVNSH